MKHFYKFYLFLALIISAIVFTCCNNNRKPISSHETEFIDTIPAIQSTPEEAVSLMLDIRKEIIETNYRDSVYITMPEDVIICIVMNNPDWDVEQVVNEYEKNKNYYNNILNIRDKIDKYRRIQKNLVTIPDTIPIKTNPDTVGQFLVFIQRMYLFVRIDTFVFYKIINTMKIYKNEYIIKDDYAILKISGNNKLINVLIDIEDINKLKKHSWRINEKGYIISDIKYRKTRIHNFILNRDTSNPKIVCDHINKNKLDNRKKNLRIVTQRENNLNRSIIENAKYYTYRKDRNKYYAYNIGYFNTEEEAKNAVINVRNINKHVGLASYQKNAS